MSRLRLGLLQTNFDTSPVIGPGFADDSHRFRDLFDALERRLSYRVYMTVGGELPGSPDEQDAFLITGSPLSVLDPLPFLPPLCDFIRACDAARKPLLGACFGHQAVALALGGRVERADTWSIGIETTAFADTRPWMRPARDRLPLYTFHQDQVTALPPGCDLLGATPTCPIASFAKGDHIFTTQAHPEFTPRFMTALLDDLRPKIGRGADWAAIDASLTGQARGDVFAQWAQRFFEGTGDGA